MKKLILCLVAALSVGGHVSGQTKLSQDAQLLAYNVGFGIATTTIGAIINKPKGQDVWTTIQNVWWQGALGGALQFTGKKLTHQIARGHYAWGWPSKLVHAAGSSICQNAAMNFRFGQYWVLDFAGVRFNFFNDRGKVSFLPQFNLWMVYDITQLAGAGKIDLAKTFSLGALAVKSPDYYLIKSDWQRYSAGTYTNSFIYSGSTNNQVFAHEMIHFFQQTEYRIFGTYLKPLYNKIYDKPAMSVMKYFYTDLPVFIGLYGLLDNKNLSIHYKNFFEFEAQFFSTNAFVKR